MEDLKLSQAKHLWADIGKDSHRCERGHCTWRKAVRGKEVEGTLELRVWGGAHERMTHENDCD